MAQIVFANGSKQMAHNNEDLFERWRLRREEMPTRERGDEPERYIEAFLPALPVEIAPEDAEALYETIQDKYRLISDRLSRINAQLKTRQPTVVYRQLSLERAELAVAFRRVQAQIRQTKQALKQFRGEAFVETRPDDPATVAGLRALLEQRKAIDTALYRYLEALIECYGAIEADALETAITTDGAKG